MMNIFLTPTSREIEEMKRPRELFEGLSWAERRRLKSEI
jgi:hypothetical protein